MKNFAKIGLALAVVFTTLSARAGEYDFSLTVTKENGKSVSFSVTDAEKVQFSIYKGNEEILFEETAKGEKAINRTYDLAAFPDGVYYLEAETSSKIARYEITVANNAAIISKAPVTEIYKPVIVKENGIITLTVPNTKTTPVEISVYDQNNGEAYNETVTNTANITKKFNVAKSAAREFTFVVNYSGKSFIQTIKK